MSGIDDDNLLLTATLAGDNTLIAGNGNSDTLDAHGSSGNNILIAGGGAVDLLNASSTSGNNILIAGNGNSDTLTVSSSHGSNTLKAGDGISDLLDASVSSGDNFLIAGNGDGDVLTVASSNGDNVLTAGNGDNDVLDASNSTGNNTLIAGNGNGDMLFAGWGRNALQGGSGDDTFIVQGPVGAGTTIAGGAGTNILQAAADISHILISNVQTLDVRGAVTLTAAQLDEFSTIQSSAFFPNIIAATGGIYSLAGKAVDAINLNLTAQSSDGTTLIGNDTAGVVLTASAAGNDNLTAGNGGDTLNAGGGNDTLLGGSGDDTLNAGTGDAFMQGNGGNDAYNFANASTDGNYIINNFHADAGQSVIQFGDGVTADQIVASRSGDDLVLTIGEDPITIQNYFSSSEFQVSNLQFVGDETPVDLANLADPLLCFLAGTRVRTPLGEMPVEELKRGDLVLTTQGCAMPVCWIGRQTVSTTFADPLRVLPIRIKAGALGFHVPSRDLLLSPDHAVLVGDILIQAGALVNGTSIVRETNVPTTLSYYHIELDDHSLILAENTPAETFVDNVDRLAFDNWDEYEALYPGGRSVEEMPHPRAKAHRQVPPDVRAMLGARAALIGNAVEPVAA
ncbi:MAG TPA: Hint domain-containing protein [Xanthobacteraceae bacterium]|nr:Hint domain-containing protein [Xanthobacteraceae bacterium]